MVAVVPVAAESKSLAQPELGSPMLVKTQVLTDQVLLPISDELIWGLVNPFISMTKLLLAKVWVEEATIIIFL